MPKKIFLESFAHHLWTAMYNLGKEFPQATNAINLFLEKIELESYPLRQIKVSWSNSDSLLVKLANFNLYTRGDRSNSSEESRSKDTFDPIFYHNKIAYRQTAIEVLVKANVINPSHLRLCESQEKPLEFPRLRLIEDELKFHNAWAESVCIEEIDVYQMNESITAPEMRFITKELGDISNLRLLDLGCGLGEASVYFALKGAKVTAVDLSDGMLNVVHTLAKRYKVKVDTINCPIENLDSLNLEPFDIVYVGNLFHHVDLPSTLEKISRVLKPGATLVSWDPVAYNPIINLYRKIATKVRTDDEQPLKLRDLKFFSDRFHSVEVRWFWLSTLLIFVWMAIFERVDPNKERYWKKVIIEGKKWSPVYRPLAVLDSILLNVFPFLRPLCWNVVIISKQKK